VYVEPDSMIVVTNRPSPDAPERKRHLFLVFPVYVPSLSWQNDRFYI
jgi:hypothetical protein